MQNVNSPSLVNANFVSIFLREKGYLEQVLVQYGEMMSTECIDAINENILAYSEALDTVNKYENALAILANRFGENAQRHFIEARKMSGLPVEAIRIGEKPQVQQNLSNSTQNVAPAPQPKQNIPSQETNNMPSPTQQQAPRSRFADKLKTPEIISPIDGKPIDSTPEESPQESEDVNVASENVENAEVANNNVKEELPVPESSVANDSIQGAGKEDNNEEVDIPDPIPAEPPKPAFVPVLFEIGKEWASRSKEDKLNINKTVSYLAKQAKLSATDVKVLCVLAESKQYDVKHILGYVSTEEERKHWISSMNKLANLQVATFKGENNENIFLEETGLWLYGLTQKKNPYKFVEN